MLKDHPKLKWNIQTSLDPHFAQLGEGLACMKIFELEKASRNAEKTKVYQPSYGLPRCVGTDEGRLPWLPGGFAEAAVGDPPV